LWDGTLLAPGGQVYGEWYGAIPRLAHRKRRAPTPALGMGCVRVSGPMTEATPRANQTRVHAGAEIPSLDELTSSAREYFEQAVSEYAQRLLSAAKNIERMERVGAGPAEITGAHVEEAKWVCLRRMRRAASPSRASILLRFVQLAASAVVTIGAASFGETWGALMCVGGISLGFAALLIERELQRDM